MYPFRSFIAGCYAGGYVPLWNPYVFSGYPFVGDIASAILYPFNIALSLFVSDGFLKFKYVEYQGIFHIFLAGLFMYCLMRSFKLDRLSACISAFVFMFSGFFIAHMGHLGMVNGAVWLPLVLLFLNKAFKENRIVWCIPCGIFLAFSISAGHPQVPLLIIFAIGLYAVYRAVFAYMDEARFTDLFRPLVFFAVTLFIGFALNISQILSVSEFFSQALVHRNSYAASTAFSSHPRNLITLLVPFFFGNQSPQVVTGWGDWNYTEMAGYVGILPILLALLGGLFKKNRDTLFFSALAVLSILLGFGGYTFLHVLNWLIVPGFDQVRCPARFVFLFDFSIAFLAGFGASFLFEELKEIHKDKFSGLTKVLMRIFCGIIGLTGLFYFGMVLGSAGLKGHQLFTNLVDNLVLFNVFLSFSLLILLWKLKQSVTVNTLKTLAVFVILLDLFTFGWQFNAGPDPRPGFDESKLIRFLKEDPSIFRIANDGVFPADLPMIHRLQSISGYVGQMLARYSRATGMNDYTLKLPPIDHGIMNLLNVKYMVTSKDFRSHNFRKVFSDGNNAVFENTNLLPRVYTAKEIVFKEKGPEILNFIRNPNFEPRQCVVLETDQMAKFKTNETMGLKFDQGHSPASAHIQKSQENGGVAGGKRVENLLFNRGFEEEGLKGWEKTNPDVFKRFLQKGKKDGMDNNYVLFFNGDMAKKPGAYYVFQELGKAAGQKLKPDCLYTLTFEGADTFKPGDSFAVKIRCFKDGGEHVDVVDIRSGLSSGGRFSWQKVQFKTSDSVDRVMLGIGANVTGGKEGLIAKIDNVNVREAHSDKNQAGNDFRYEFVQYSGNRLALNFHMPQGGMLVLSEIYYPGWKAFLDGKEKEIYKTNYLFKSIYAPEGNHHLELVFEPANFTFGMVFTISLLVLLLLLFSFGLRRKNQRWL
ncbi:MAG: YfhO family protein [Deltaproteobacteria bacterium]|nr:YfhO family protein [Deltaproteobacteria bacterium]